MNNVFICGGTSPIARAIIDIYIKNGFAVYFSYCKNSSIADEIMHQYRDFSIHKIHINLDNTNQFAQIAQQLPESINVYINAAKHPVARQNLTQTSIDEIEKQIRIGLTNPILLLRYLYEKCAKDMVLINFGSKSYVSGGINTPIYSATRGAWNSFSRALANDYPDWRVYCVNPPKIDDENLLSIAAQIYAITYHDKKSGSCIDLFDWQ